MKTKSLSVILPAKNEASALSKLLPHIRELYQDAEIIVVNDGSVDDTATTAEQLGARVLSHPYSMGNGAAIKTGTRAASGDILIFMDADGQHDPTDIPHLLEKLEKGYDMAVGARRKTSQANLGRGIANQFYNRLASWIVGHPILDLTSGFRAVCSEKFREFIYLLPNGFSYPTTITMAFFRAGYLVSYLPIHAGERIGKSHIRPVRDGIRFLLIIFKVGTLYSPLKIFFPASICLFGLGALYYAHTYIAMGRFTNMSALLFITSIVVFLIGLVSEQITSLMYRKGP